MFECRMEERVFWETMNPRRLHALFNARFRAAKSAHSSRTSRYVNLDTPAGSGESLAGFISKGG